LTSSPPVATAAFPAVATSGREDFNAWFSHYRLSEAFLEFHREQAYCDLMALDDHSLADIGLRPEVIAGTTRRSLQHQAHRAVVDEYFRSL
jgi:uncharacterized protein YjiS (DUF1127 family)